MSTYYLAREGIRLLRDICRSYAEDIEVMFFAEEWQDTSVYKNECLALIFMEFESGRNMTDYEALDLVRHYLIMVLEYAEEYMSNNVPDDHPLLKQVRYAIDNPNEFIAVSD